jgi:hypothetical protein
VYDLLILTLKKNFILINYHREAELKKNGEIGKLFFLNKTEIAQLN